MLLVVPVVAAHTTIRAGGAGNTPSTSPVYKVLLVVLQELHMDTTGGGGGASAVGEGAAMVLLVLGGAGYGGNGIYWQAAVG